MHVCATLGSSGKRLRGKYTKEKSHEVVVFHVCVGSPVSNRLQWKFLYRFRSATLSIMPFLIVVLSHRQCEFYTTAIGVHMDRENN
jgi:hypothetical protein